MQLTTCRETWSALRHGGRNPEACAAIQLLLCRQFELARAMREGARPAAVREIEGAVQPMIHECFAKVSGIGFRRGAASRCDICRLIEAARRVAYSKYAAEFLRYLEKTRDNEESRLSRDLAEVFREYIRQVGRSDGDWLVERMTRAAAIMERIHDLFLAGHMQRRSFVANGHGAPAGMREILDRAEQRLDTLRAGAMRIVSQPAQEAASSSHIVKTLQ